MDEELDERVENIRASIRYENNYEKSINQSKELYNDIKNNDDSFIHWFCIYNIAFCYRKIGDIEESIKYAKKAILYQVEKDNYIKVLWLLAVNYADKGFKKMAIQFYMECLKYYRETNIFRLRVSILFNIAKLQDKPLTMIKLMKILSDNEDFTYKNMSQSEVGKEQLLLAGYKEIIEYCQRNNCKSYIFYLVNSISRKEIKNEVKKMINDKRIKVLLAF